MVFDDEPSIPPPEKCIGSHCNLDLLNFKYNQFIFVPNCTEAVNLVKFQHGWFIRYYANKVLVHNHGCTALHAHTLSQTAQNMPPAASSQRMHNHTVNRCTLTNLKPVHNHSMSCKTTYTNVWRLQQLQGEQKKVTPPLHDFCWYFSSECKFLYEILHDC